MRFSSVFKIVEVFSVIYEIKVFVLLNGFENFNTSSMEDNC